MPDLFGHASAAPAPPRKSARPRKPVAPGVRVVRSAPAPAAPPRILQPTCWPHPCRPEAAAERAEDFHLLGATVGSASTCSTLPPAAVLARLEASHFLGLANHVWTPGRPGPCPYRPGAVHRRYTLERTPMRDLGPVIARLLDPAAFPDLPPPARAGLEVVARDVATMPPELQGALWWNCRGLILEHVGMPDGDGWKSELWAVYLGTGERS